MLEKLLLSKIPAHSFSTAGMAGKVDFVFIILPWEKWLIIFIISH